MPVSAQTRVGREEGVRRASGVAILVFSFPRAPCTPPSGQQGQEKELILCWKALSETPKGLQWGFMCIFPIDLEVLSDESFVVILSIPSF